MRPALPILTTLALTTIASADYETRVVVRNLDKPTGIAVTGNSHNRHLFVTQLPTPGVNGMNGGRNTVDLIRLRDRRIFNLTTGEPEPTNLAFDGWKTPYWTCKSAGVILERNMWTGRVEPLRTGLMEPIGIAVGEVGEVYFTQVPTPGVNGNNGGMNTVVRYDLGNGTATKVDEGDPEPTDITEARDGTLYWTCTSADVIVEARLRH